MDSKSGPTRRSEPANLQSTRVDPEATYVGDEAGRADDEGGASDSGRQTDAGAMDATYVPPDGPGSEAPKRPAAAPVAKPAATAKPAGAEKKLSQLGDFKLIKKLGQGGMGEVYLAHQVSLDRQVALKIMAKQIASKPGFVERFYREARTMAKLDHPNIVRGYAVGEDQGFHFVAMELIDGKSMQDWLDQLRKLTVGDALHVAIKAADALQHAHDLGLIHRDIKPDNMLVTSKGVLKVSDLGLAKQVDEDNSMTQSGTGLGTPYYMPPEQARNAKHVDHRSDIYALGSTIYHMLSGQYPFKAESTLELILAKEKGQFVPIRRHNPDVPDRLSLIIDKMMAKDPQHRYQNCAALIRDLEALGMASDTLSFIPNAAPSGAATLGRSRSGAGSSAPPTALPPAPTRAAASAPAAAGPAASRGPGDRSANPSAPVPGNIWYLKYPDAAGKLVQAKLTTEQVLNIVKTGQLDLRAKASRTKEGAYLPLAQYPEFATIVNARLVKEKADKKASDVKSAYARFDREDRWRKRLRWLRKLTESTAGLINLIVYLAVVGAVIVGGYWAVMAWIWPMIKAKLNS